MGHLLPYLPTAELSPPLLRNPGLASAASILMGLVLIVLTLVQLGVGRRGQKDGGR